jgi:hypothetical protein
MTKASHMSHDAGIGDQASFRAVTPSLYKMFVVSGRAKGSCVSEVDVEETDYLLQT